MDCVERVHQETVKERGRKGTQKRRCRMLERWNKNWEPTKKMREEGRVVSSIIMKLHE